MSEPLRVRTSITIGGAPKTAAGSWATVENRDRRGTVGFHYLGQLTRAAPTGFSRTARLLTPDQRRQIYETTPDVRACVDSIARRVSTWDWTIEVKLDPRDKGYEAAIAEKDRVEAWLSAPNLDGETWQEILVKSVTDLLTDDAGTWELVSDRAGKTLTEINVLRGCYVWPVMGVTGRIAAYVQDPTGSATYDPTLVEEAIRKQKAVSKEEVEGAVRSSGTPVSVVFAPEDIVQFRLFPNTAWPGLGMPLLESLVNEVVTVLLAADHLVLAYDADEIPPGLLVIGGLGATAMKQARADFEHMKGKDGKIRLISSDLAGAGVDAKWIEMRRSLKDLDLASVVKEVKRTIYRVFGVMPIEMGVTEDMPRAVGAAMVDLGQSHLLEPILELIQAKVNARVLPRIVGKKWQGILKFEFDRTAKRTPAEEKDVVSALSEAHKRGAITTNEWRQAQKLAPFGEEGDVPLIDTPSGPVPLVRVALPPEEPEEPEEPESGPGGGPEEPEPEEPTGDKGEGGTEEPEEPEEEDVPGEAARAPAPDRRGHVHIHRAHIPSADDLPSDWQPAGRFKDAKTVDLTRLAYDVVEYVQVVDPLYRDAAEAVLRAIRNGYEPGETTAEDAERLADRCDVLLRDLAGRWSVETTGLYRATVDAAVRKVRGWTEYDVSVADRNARADAYRDAAMGYLTAPEGLIGTLSASVREALQRVAGVPLRSIDVADEHQAAVDAIAAAIDGDVPEAVAAARISALAAGATEAELLGAVAHAFEANAYRTANWSGALVELANETLTHTLGEAERAALMDPNRDPAAPVVFWYGEWVDVGDGATCRVCLHEGSLGFRPLSQITFVPGSQQTLCKKRCRCVVQVVTSEELANGQAVSLAGSAPPSVP